MDMGSNSSKHRTLASTLFHLLPEPVWESLRERMTQHAFEPGETIVAQGTMEPDFHVIIEGVAAVVAQTREGESRELGRLGFGECVGEMSLLTGDPASADVVAVTRTTTYSVSQAGLAAIGGLRAQLIEALSAILAARLKHANERLLSRHAANVHVICCAAEDIGVVAGLGDAIARATGRRVLTLAVDSVADRVSSLHAARSDVRALDDGALSAIQSVIASAERDYDDILVLGHEQASHAMAPDAASMLHVVRDDGLQLVPSSHMTAGQLIAITGEASTVPVLARMSQRAGRPVVAILPATTSGGIDKLARLLTGRTVGVAFGAGAAKGLAHLGVLRALAEMRVPIDAVSGCSIGAAVAAGYASGLSIDELTDSTVAAAARAIRPALPLRSFLSNAGIREELRKLAGDLRIEDLNLPTAIIATDLFRRAEVNFTSGLLWPRLLASMAIPGVYPPSPGMGSWLVDGGVLNPVPVRQCRELGAGVVIGVRLTATRTSPRERLETKPGKPLAIETIMRTFEIMLNRISEVSHEQADINLEICIDGTGGVRDFQRGREIADAGYRAAMNVTPAVQRVLPYAMGATA